MTIGQKFLEMYKAPLLELCRRYPVERLYLFGSILTDNFDPAKSDVDIQAIFETLRNQDPIERGEQMWRFWNELEVLFGRKVDLLTKPFIRNPYLRKEVESTRQLIYEGQVRQIMGLRNRIVHEYDDLDETMIWQTIHESLPVLNAKLN